LNVAAGYVAGRPLPPGSLPLSGIAVRVIDFRKPGDTRPAHYYGSAVTGADGRWTVMGVPPGTEYGIDVQCNWPTGFLVDAPPCSATAPWSGATYGQFELHPIVANQVVQTDDAVLIRAMTVTSTGGASVAAGPDGFSWAPALGSTVYCVAMFDETAPAVVSAPSGNCANQGGSAETTATTWTSPPLVSGHDYVFTVAAWDRTPDLNAWLTRGISSTQLGQGSIRIHVR
jgi:hypothetical protein